MSLDWVVSPQRLAGAAAVLVSYAALCASVAWSVRRKRLDLLLDNQEATGRSKGPAVLVCYASQTGQAEGLAREAARMLRDSEVHVTLLPLEAVTAGQLEKHEYSFWIASTTGEGDAPDHALHFVRELLPQTLDLKCHQALVLALGDKEYQQFCLFGEQVHAWLGAQGARSELICVDNMDRAALRAWQSRINVFKQEWLADDDSQPPSVFDEEWLLPPADSQLVLKKRTLLNPGSEGGPLFQLDWIAAVGEELPHWESGDLVSVRVPADPEHPRDYSIASIMEDGCLRMLVRQSVRADGTPGVASNWLCSGMKEGQALAMSIRQHSSFRLGDNAKRPLILIGNGSGLAGLLSHIRARAALNQREQWLIFGERSPKHDALMDATLQQWLRSGDLALLDRAWSRAESGRTYVQDLVLERAATIREWVARDAAIFVCGSRQGMGEGVHQALRQVLGEAQLHALMQSGRYRRDVY